MISDDYRRVPSSLRAKILFCADALHGLMCLHACNVLHGDVKCDNALVHENSMAGTAENRQVKLSDFSHSIILDEHEGQLGVVTHMIRGTQLYRPPELCSGYQYPSIEAVKLSDIWCFGLMVWEVMMDGNYRANTASSTEACLKTASPAEHCADSLRTRHIGDHELRDNGEHVCDDR
ncbi:kinase-like protein [Ophiobolus disseminans]|uniref:Kinase-like protein n=1 Tax=Ophiobolus disseminans TaxID=1469910 RepID=A0A6A6ZX67_9PLEO|nr:kinase-like protein [Ophiobolus disseminans]